MQVSKNHTPKSKKNKWLSVHISLVFAHADFEAINKSPLNPPIRPANGMKKHVQFPDNFNGVVQEIVSCGDDSNGNGSDTMAIDTPPSVIVVSF